MRLQAPTWTAEGTFITVVGTNFGIFDNPIINWGPTLTIMPAGVSRSGGGDF